MKPSHYSSYMVYGLHLVSDRPIPGLVCHPSEPCRLADISIWFDMNGAEADLQNPAEQTLWYTSYLLDERGNPVLKIWKETKSGDYRIRYSHGLEFRVDRTISVVRILGLEATSLDDVATFLLGPVLGILLRLRGVTCLHASAVAMGGQAVAFVGVEGAGKSTTAALFAKMGHSAISDDIVALLERDHSFDVLPAYPYLSLWPESVEMLCGDPQALPSLTPDWEKRQLPLNDEGPKFQREALPLGAIYLLGERSAESKTPFVEEMTPQEGLMALVANTYANRLLDAQMRAEEFRVLGRLANSFPIRRLNPHENPARLGRLYEVICEDFAVLPKRARVEA